MKNIKLTQICEELQASVDEIIKISKVDHPRDVKTNEIESRLSVD